MIAGLRDEDSVAELCRKEGINPGMAHLRSQPGVHELIRRRQFGHVAGPLWWPSASVASCARDRKMIKQLALEYTASVDEQAAVNSFVRHLHSVIAPVALLKPA